MTRDHPRSARRQTCFAVADDGIVLDVRVTTRASRDAVDGVGALSDRRVVAHVRVRALPADGAANKAVCAVVAKALRRPKSAVMLTSGARSRVKRMRIAGVASELAAVVEGWPRRPG